MTSELEEARVVGPGVVVFEGSESFGLNLVHARKGFLIVSFLCQLDIELALVSNGPKEPAYDLAIAECELDVVVVWLAFVVAFAEDFGV